MGTRERYFYWSAILVLLVALGFLIPANRDYARLRRYAENHICDPHVEWLRHQLPRLNERLPKADCPSPGGS